MAADAIDLDLQDVVAAPLQAVAEAQMRTALALVELVRDLALEEAAEGRPNRLRSIDFTFEREVVDARGRSRRVRRTVQVPLLAMVTLPSLEVERVEYRCRVRVNRTEVQPPAAPRRLSPELAERFPALASRLRLRVAPAMRRSTRRGEEVAAPWDLEIAVVARGEEPAEGTERLLALITAALRETEAEEE